MASPSTRREGIDDTFSLDDVFALLDAGFFDEDDEIQESINSMDTELEEKANPTLLPCEICGKMLKSSAGLKRHIYWFKTSRKSLGACSKETR